MYVPTPPSWPEVQFFLLTLKGVVHCVLSFVVFDEKSAVFIYLLIFIDRGQGGEGEEERERNIDVLFYLFMHSLTVSCMCPDRGSNLQPWCIEMAL